MKFLLCSLLLFGNILLAFANNTIKAVLFPYREAVISSRVESVLEPWEFRIGESFKKDAVIIKLNDRNYSLRLQQAKQQMDYLNAVYQDKKELRAKNFTSDFELKKAEFEFKQAENDYSLALLNLSYCQIKAPFAGKIVEFLTQEYETVRAGQALLRIIDDSFLFAVMNIPQKKLPQIGSVVKIIFDGIVIEGQVYEISPKADHRTDTVKVRVLIDNSKGQFRAGMTGELINGK
jgi:RND family efflux transporter MFP subunit